MASSLNSYFYLPRAGRYANAKNSNDRLRIVRGDLTDGSSGVWELPCIDTVNFVYAFAAHEVLSVANGNAISIYADGALVNPTDYAFDEANNVEGEGTIATVTFTTDRANQIITARGKGKPTTAGGSTLMDHIIDIIEDFLTVENSFPAAILDATMEARARSVFTAQGFAAAGVINEDGKIWDIIQGMIGSFYGNAWLTAQGKVALDIDDGTVSDYGCAAVLRFGDIELIEAKQRESTLINQCPISYAYNYARGEFTGHTDTAAHASAISQNTFGVQEPASPVRLYWCRALASAQKVQDVIVEKFKWPVWEVEIEAKNLRNIRADQGEIIAATIDWLYDKNGEPLYNEYWRIVGVKPDFQRAVERIRMIDTGHYMTAGTYVADGTFTAGGEITAGGSRDKTLY